MPLMIFVNSPILEPYMSKLAAFDELLQQYKTFNYHDNPVLAQRLQDVQTWLKERMKETHHDFLICQNTN